ncbi:MAG: hypothetical protein NUV83_01925 [Candidatus Wolfebacteria bacterium]|nr:hypothetical protein [Candidatus Wolfebacteria bacterium]
MEYQKEETIICIPGLGGHKTSFKGYDQLLSNYKVIFTEITDPKPSFEKIAQICEKEKSVILLTNCYGAQLGISLIKKFPEKIKKFVIIEPFFAEFHLWRHPARVVNFILFALFSILDYFYLRRRFFYNPDYDHLAKYPIFIQPIFDLSWHNWTFYFKKSNDILYFRLPKNPVTVPTLIFYSSKGFTRDKKTREAIRSVFVNSQEAEVNPQTHLIIKHAKETIGQILRDWLSK